MENQFVTRPDPKGFSVFDRATGDAVIIASTPQVGLSQADADHTASVLNERAQSAN